MFDLAKVFNRKKAGSSSIIYNDDQIDFRPYAFVLNVKELVHESLVEVAPGYTLRRAQDAEIAYIKEFITEHSARSLSTSIWETRPVASGKLPKLPKKLWRYFVIEFDTDDPDLDLLEAALAVATTSLEIAFAKIRVDVNGVTRPACLYRTPRLFQSISALDLAGAERDDQMLSVGKAEGDEIRQIFTRMAEHDHTILGLTRVVELLLELKDLPRFSPLQVLGYFAILESVLTHQPNPEDRYESITRQITQKLALLNRRWSSQLDYTPFAGAAHEKIWSKMYAYRSAIAHGRKPDFKSQLGLLKDANSANLLIRDAVKKAIRQAFVEPQLMADLHNV